MKLPCEIIIVDILPVIRKELSVKLVEDHGFMKTRVAKMFGVSGTAISQYLHGMRGNSAAIAVTPQYESFLEEISVSAVRIAAQKSTVAQELCRLCDLVKKNGMVQHLRGIESVTPIMSCVKCPKDQADSRPILQ
jgi:predicted transcriptional regulator